MSTYEIDETLGALFIAETREQLESFSKILMKLESDPGSIETEVHELFRIAHNIKGTAGMMGLDGIKETMHMVENLFDELRKNVKALKQEQIDALLELSDALDSYVEAANWTVSWDTQAWANAFKVKSNQSATEAEDNSKLSTAKFAFSFNKDQRTALTAWLEAGKSLYRVELLFQGTAAMKSVSVMTFSKFLEKWGVVFVIFPDFNDPDFETCQRLFLILQSESKIDQANLEQISKYPVLDVAGVAIEQWTALPEEKPVATVDQTDGVVKSLNSQTIRVDSSKIDKLINYMGELLTVKAGFNELVEEQNEENAQWNQLSKLVQQLEHITGDIQVDLLDLRMVPMEQVFSRFPRTVRDIAKRNNKSVELKVIGGEAEIDKQIAEQLVNPLTHLVRNAVDHGLEKQEIRQAKGKSKTGKITLKAEQEGNYVVISISDDGAGLDLEKIRRKAIEKELISANSELTREETMSLIFRPGFSTAAEVTDISGRGVGLDVVETSLKELKGEIEIQSENGQGTTFRLKVPLTLAVIQVFLVRIGGQTLAIPTGNVTESYAFEPKQLKYIGGNRAFMLRQELIPLLNINSCFRISEPELEKEEIITTVILKRGQQRLGLMVDELVGNTEIMIKRINQALPDNPLISGATLMGNGSVGLILDINEIFNEATMSQTG